MSKVSGRPTAVGHALAGYAVPALLRTLSADCPRRQAVSIYALCDAHAPELSKLFLGKIG